MPITGTGSQLGLELQSVLGTSDFAGGSAWRSFGTACCTWVPSTALVLPGTMVAVGAGVTGFGALALGPSSGLASSIIAALGISDPQLTVAFQTLVDCIVSHMVTYGQCSPTAFVANPSGGPVTGLGLLTFTNIQLGQTIVSRLQIQDEAGIAAWNAWGNAFLLHMTANGVIPALGFTSPFGGGALVGAAQLT